MDALVTALAPAFVVALCLQQLTELLVPLAERRARGVDGNVKRMGINVLTIVLGIILALLLDLGILRSLGMTAVARWLDVGLTALVVSGGTEGVNSIVKFMGYSKQAKKDQLSPGGTAPANQTTIAQKLNQLISDAPQRPSG